MSDREAAGEPEINAAAIVAALNRHQVRYVIIGAFAAIAQQAPIPATRDIDLTPEASQENLARLFGAEGTRCADPNRCGAGGAALQP